MVITIYELMGLIKDDKAPKKIKYNGEIFDWNGYNYNEENSRVFLSEYICDEVDIDIPNLKIIILEENSDDLDDEWEDIEEINVTKENCKRFIEYDSETGYHKYTIRLLDEYFSNKINQLISNQKYLKERLDKDESRL